jgi:TRAP-type mannitol/chloroaromatic compound transport system permease small subunit
VKVLLGLSRLVDALNERVGRIVLWLVLASVLISAGNAVVRKVFGTSSNAWLEIQWYLYAAVFLMAAGYTLKYNEHVRIDVITGRFSQRTRNWIDVFGLTVFLMPWALLMVWLGWPFFMQAYVSGEVSSNFGGLIRWPVYIFIPLGFGLLGLQGISELIKRVAFLLDKGPDPLSKPIDKTAEEDLAEFVRSQQGADGTK